MRFTCAVIFLSQNMIGLTDNGGVQGHQENSQHERCCQENHGSASGIQHSIVWSIGRTFLGSMNIALAFYYRIWRPHFERIWCVGSTEEGGTCCTTAEVRIGRDEALPRLPVHIEGQVFLLWLKR